MPNLGPNITRARKRRGLSVAELAKELGISRAAVYQWERNARAPAKRHVLKLAEILQLPLKDFRPANSTGASYPRDDTDSEEALSHFWELLDREGRRKLVQVAAKLVREGKP
jgi:transcriptional regulator with XRE-family HTH domain